MQPGLLPQPCRRDGFNSVSLSGESLWAALSPGELPVVFHADSTTTANSRPCLMREESFAASVFVLQKRLFLPLAGPPALPSALGCDCLSFVVCSRAA